jgi:hypothetical protein
VRASVGTLDADGWTSGARALEAMRPRIRARVRAVVVAPDGSLTVQLPNLDVTYGPPGDEDAKAAALQAVLDWAERGAVSLASIDLTVPDAPTATTADGRAVTP